MTKTKVDIYRIPASLEPLMIYLTASSRKDLALQERLKMFVTHTTDVLSFPFGNFRGSHESLLNHRSQIYLPNTAFRLSVSVLDI